MKNCLLAALLLFISTTLLAQKIADELSPFKWQAPTDWSNWQAQLHDDHYYVVVPKMKPEFAAKVSVVQLLATDIWLVKIHKSQSLQDLGVEQVSALPTRHKIHPHLLETDAEKTVWIKTYEAKNTTSLPVLAVASRQILPPNIVQANLSSNQIRQLAALPYVAFIQRAPQPAPLLSENLIFHHAYYVKQTNTWGLSGDKVVVGIADGGTVRDHIDLNAQLFNADTIDINSHASAVSGIVAGNGMIDERTEGFAPKATLISDYYTNMIVKSGQYHTNFDLSIVNHSYATGWEGAFCDATGSYDITSELIDEVVNEFPNVLHCIAAGNSGTATCAPYPTGYGSVLNGIQSAKNVLTVGALQGLNQIWTSSSRGPVYGGRLKPEIVAMGTSVRSTSTLNSYTNNNGTSFASPSIAGAAALVTERYQQLFPNTIPDATLLKGILCNSATDLGQAGPDFTYGFGRLDVTKAVQIIDNQSFVTDSLSETEVLTFSIHVPAEAEQLKVMLVWNDPAAAPFSTSTLINDLDIEIVAPDMTVHYPWLLDTAATQVHRAAFQGSATQRDRINNIEQVTIDTPIAGVYEIKIQGHAIAMGKQVFHIVYDWSSPLLELRYPSSGETFAPNENLHIRWADTLGIASDTLALFYSVDAGSTWTTIDENISGATTQYPFTVPDIVSDEVQIRIQDKAGTRADTTGNFTIMGRPNLTAETMCGGQVELSWLAIDHAARYDIFEWTNNDWQLLTSTTNLNYSLSNLVAGSYPCYSVQAVSVDDIRGLRSIGRCVYLFGEVVDTFPYRADFESVDDSWWTTGKNNDWELGVPNNSIIDKAANGTQAWVTDLESDYSNAGLSLLQTPCFDLSQLTTPTIAFALHIDIENNEDEPSNVYDFVRFQYSTNGENWIVLGSNGDGYNWYNNAGNANVWDGTYNDWQIARYAIPTTASTVRFRWQFNSDRFVTQEGVGIDEVYIYDAAKDDHFVQLTAKVSLEGAFETATMRDDLRQLHQLPLTQPYTDYSGTETITDNSLLQTTGSTAIVDWVLVDLYLNGSKVATQAALVQRNGTIVNTTGHPVLTFFGLEANDYQIGIRHRNHLGVVSELEVPLSYILLD